mmetsp:Transcript_11885/g.21991  ORF Transcript_11885/g.21991 Transcript_11885/m.21991 type:complete len:271 (+) Transcript_11885:693-1505(+)
MFRGDIIGNGNALFDVLTFHCKRLFQSFQGGRSIRFGQGIHLGFDFLIDRIDGFGTGTQQNGPGHHIVFGLGNQIRSDNFGIGRVIANHQDFRGTCQHINSAFSIDNRLGRRHPLIAWATNNIARRDMDRLFSIGSVQPICHGRHGLCTTDTQKGIHSGKMSCRQGDGCRFGTCQNDRFATCRSSRHSCHQHTRRQGISSTGSITSRGFTGTDCMSRFPTRNIHFHVDHRFPLHLCKGLDPSVNILKGRSLRFRQAFKRRLTSLFGDQQI